MVLEHHQGGLPHFASNANIQPALQLYAAAAAAHLGPRQAGLPQWPPFLHRFGVPGGVFGSTMLTRPPRFGIAEPGGSSSMMTRKAAEEISGVVVRQSMAGGLQANDLRLIEDHLGNGTMRLQQMAGGDNRIMSGPASVDSNEEMGEFNLTTFKFSLTGLKKVAYIVKCFLLY